MTELVRACWCEASVIGPVGAAVAGKATSVMSCQGDDGDSLPTFGGVLAVDIAVNLLNVAPQPTLVSCLAVASFDTVLWRPVGHHFTQTIDNIQP